MKIKNYKQYSVFFKPKLVVMLLTFLGTITISFQSFGQGYTAVGSCGDSVVVTDGTFTYPTNLYYHPCLLGGENPCYFISNCISAMSMQYRLQKWNPTTPGWEWASSYQSSKKFTGLGTSLTKYRVVVLKPYIVVNTSCEGDYEEVWSQLGQFLGYRGLFAEYFTNEVFVGQPNGSNNEFKFVDGNNVLLFGSDPGLPIFDIDENWKIDVSESTNYNSWWLAMYKDDDPTNLPWGDYDGGWHSDGPPSNPVINLADWWRNSEGNPFDPNESYVVQWVATNKDCSSWNVNEMSAYICPETLDCKIGIIMGEEEDQIEIYPNPVHDQFYLSGQKNVSQVELMDVFGRKQEIWTANLPHYDVSQLVSGTYYVQFFDKNHRLLQVAPIQVIR